MSLTSLNNSTKQQLATALSKCCGSSAWIEKMISVFPVPDETTLFDEARKKWLECRESDWLEAFSHHPKIGDIASLREKFLQTAIFTTNEQSSINNASNQVLEDLADGNRAYEKKFGYIFIVCATGKMAEEMLHILRARLANTKEDEIKIAMEEQHKITVLRLKKILEP